ncbi:CBS-domain-containing protein [Mycena chlorophos]|uniref:CBS-domain-containing protein n=1 Tax=Mycena chlorophos TaxID=658473 RepID=A0A8H6T4P6_MYCCL|nr:CBS-domain-containing protein [Mycena chlorophos]
MPPPKRPSVPRTVSFGKRHASFDTPREVPLPSPSSAVTRPPATDGHGPVFDEDDHDWELVSPATSKLHKAKHKQPAPPTTQPAAPPSPPSAFATKPNKLKSNPSSILPYTRPYSLPESHSYHGRKPDATAHSPPTADRTSSASLPLPMQVPFTALPKLKQPSLPSPVYERTASEAALRPPLHSSSSSSSGSSGSLPSAPPSRSPSRSPVPDSDSASSLPKRGAAPMPPAEQTTSHGGVASYRPARTTYTPVPTAPPDDTTTAINRTPSIRTTASLPPPEPPVILPGAENEDESDAGPSAPPARGSNGATEPSRLSKSSSSRASGASYEPFLSHASPPVDSWIEVESTPAAYKLIVRLPGFKRDGITLATKKRRILHLVADSWDAEGGHFERRISFGYDADLALVRAEFDGELLIVVIPRKIPPGMPGSGSEPHAAR